MFKVLKNLKNSLVSVVIIVILLCIQAMADLSLPDYTSKVVNIGIQQGGIESIVPEAIRKSKMEELLVFTMDDNKILDNYTLISKSNLSQQEYDKYVKKYPVLENEDIYILNKITSNKEEELETMMLKPILALNIINNKQSNFQIIQKLIQVVPEQLRDDVINLDMESIKQIPEDELMFFISEAYAMLQKGMSTMIEQVAIAAVKAEYTSLGINMDEYQTQYILKVGAQMLGIALVSMVSAIIIMLLSSRVAAKLSRNLRDKVFKKVLKFSTKEFRDFSTASLITRSTSDIQQIQMLIGMLFRVVVYAPIIGVGGFLRVLGNSNTSMAWIIGLAIFAILVVVMTLFIVAMPKFKRLQNLIDKLNLVTREILTGLPVIRAFHTEEKEEARFNEANRDLTKANIFVNTAMSIMMPTLMFIMNVIAILIVWVGGKNVDLGIMQVGDIMAFIQYTMQIVMAFLMISMISIMLPRASVSARRINEVLETEPSIKDPDKELKFDENKKGYVEFKDVSFRYPDADTEILTDIDFVAKPGQTTAIIGSTGSGKSTVVNLIPRFYDVTGGELLVDGINVKDISQSKLREKIGFVPQKGMLFSGTIESNIKYGKNDISDEQMNLAAEIAQAKEFIDKKEKGYKSEIAQGGNNVSGGQKQRLSIARAIAIDPEILVFDDSFSALDFKTDAKLREELKKNTENKTIIIVAQRISTVLNADQIIVLEEGKIVGKGTHEELMKNCETYKQIALSQLSEDELK